jgi:hypothetical protein
MEAATWGWPAGVFNPSASLDDFEAAAFGDAHARFEEVALMVEGSKETVTVDRRRTIIPCGDGPNRYNMTQATSFLKEIRRSDLSVVKKT